jgi:hypothetical protein
MGMQAPLVRLIDTRIDRAENELIGTVLTPAYKWYDHAFAKYLWAMDVDLDTDGTRPDSNIVVKAVPIADASHGVHKAGPGTKVRLHRLSMRRGYEIVGVASIVNGQVSVIEVTYGASSITVGTATTYGSEYRLLNYDDLGDANVNGGYKYGILPYGTLGKYDASGNLQYVLVTP